MSPPDWQRPGPPTPALRVRTWLRGTDDDQRAGLLGYVSLVYGDLVLDGITVRRTNAGQLTLSYPERRDGQGRRHSLIKPVDDDARLRIEKAVFDAATVTEEAQR